MGLGKQLHPIFQAYAGTGLRSCSSAYFAGCNFSEALPLGK
jgi:hypothetical protein